MPTRATDPTAGDSAILSVPAGAVAELETAGLATPMPKLRGPALDAVVSVGMDTAALVTLMQTPDAIRAFAEWIRDRCTRSGDSLELTAKRGDRKIRLTVTGDVDVTAVAEFLTNALDGRA